MASSNVQISNLLASIYQMTIIKILKNRIIIKTFEMLKKVRWANLQTSDKICQFTN